jgi:hypothetical protein
VRKLEGGCHCGAVRYVLDWPEAAKIIPARRCNCSFCTRFNGTWTSHPDALIDITVDPAQPMSVYRFGTQTAGMLFCGRCGVMVFATCKLDDRTRAVVNVNTLDEGQECELELSDSCFEEEALEQRLERRAANWIGHVRFRPFEPQD